MLTAKKILKITKPEDLFSVGDEEVIKNEFNKMAKEFHPDKGGDTEVFAHVNVLKEQALKILKNGTWTKNGVHMFTTNKSQQFRILYKHQFAFELGNVYITDTKLFYFIEKKHKALYSNALNHFKFRFIDEKMKKEFTRFLPDSGRTMESDDHYILIHEKTKDVVPVSGIISYFKDGLDPHHTAWVISSMCNMLCYLYWARKEHLAINANSYFVSPEFHSGLLLGSWFYCKNKGDKIEMVLSSTYTLMTPTIGGKVKKIAGHKTDAALVKDLGRKLMGKYMSKMKFPEYKEMIDWLLLPSSGNPYKMFHSWDETLMKTFGKRRFIPLDISTDDIYKGM